MKWIACSAEEKISTIHIYRMGHNKSNAVFKLVFMIFICQCLQLFIRRPLLRQRRSTGPALSVPRGIARRSSKPYLTGKYF